MGYCANMVKSNGTTGEEEINYQISTEQNNPLHFFTSQIGVLPLEILLTAPYLLKSKSHFLWVKLMNMITHLSKTKSLQLLNLR